MWVSPSYGIRSALFSRKSQWIPSLLVFSSSIIFSLLPSFFPPLLPSLSLFELHFYHLKGKRTLTNSKSALEKSVRGRVSLRWSHLLSPQYVLVPGAREASKPPAPALLRPKTIRRDCPTNMSQWEACAPSWGPSVLVAGKSHWPPCPLCLCSGYSAFSSNPQGAKTQPTLVIEGFPKDGKRGWAPDCLQYSSKAGRQIKTYAKTKVWEKDLQEAWEDQCWTCDPLTWNYQHDVPALESDQLSWHSKQRGASPKGRPSLPTSAATWHFTVGLVPTKDTCTNHLPHLLSLGPTAQVSILQTHVILPGSCKTNDEVPTLQRRK